MSHLTKEVNLHSTMQSLSVTAHIFLLTIGLDKQPHVFVFMQSCIEENIYSKKNPPVSRLISAAT